MSEYCFSVTNARLPGGKREATRRDRIARRIDPTAGYVYYFDKASRMWRGWGYVANRGEPFDSQAAAKIRKAWAVLNSKVSS